jgi:hypothetical protein
MNHTLTYILLLIALVSLIFVVSINLLFKDFKELEIKVKEMGERHKKLKEKKDEEKNNI